MSISCKHILNEDSILNMCWIGNAYVYITCLPITALVNLLSEIILVRFKCIHKWCFELCACILCLYMANFWQYLIHRFYANQFPVFLVEVVLACIAHDIISHHLGVSISVKHLFSSSIHYWICDPHYRLSLHQEWTILMIFVFTASGKSQIFLIGT